MPLIFRRAAPGPEGFDDDLLSDFHESRDSLCSRLQKVASGGELSRVMLAIKTVLADKDAVGTMIFR